MGTGRDDRCQAGRVTTDVARTAQAAMGTGGRNDRCQGHGRPGGVPGLPAATRSDRPTGVRPVTAARTMWSRGSRNGGPAARTGVRSAGPAPTRCRCWYCNGDRPLRPASATLIVPGRQTPRVMPQWGPVVMTVSGSTGSGTGRIDRYQQMASVSAGESAPPQWGPGRDDRRNGDRSSRPVPAQVRTSPPAKAA